ncbi:pilus assembly protein TadG-related protein [Novosphingobium rosa]|uniref:pilus assembly protein TadG-related protein n=1 Tax=Novosphingobium rosa TaxID=76978 RepID=UPI00082D2CD5|nr:pilus assembly protein TadG-related protein [Novosphingobium rosa]
MPSLPARLPAHWPDRLVAFLRRLRADRRGNVLLMMGAALPLLLLAVGFGIDYARAQRLQTKLDAAADAAALATVDPTLLNIDNTNGQVSAAAEAMFDQQVKGLAGLTVISRHADVNDKAGGSLATLRKTTFTYTATSANLFSGVLRMTNLTIGGSAVASASTPPSMNFYIAMDNSPSMLLPTTQTGIDNLKAGAWWTGEPYYFSGGSHGCDFACHATNMHEWNAGVYVLDASQNSIYLNNQSNSGTVPFYRLSCAGVLTDSNNASVGTNGVLVNGTGKSASNVPTYCNYTKTMNQARNPADNPVYIKYTPTGSSTTSYLSVNYPDTFWLAQNYTSVNPGAAPITLRTDAERDAAVNLIQYANTIEQQYAKANVPPIYKMQFYTFNASGTLGALSTDPFGTMTDVSKLQLGANFPTASSLVPLLPASGTYTSFTSMLNTMMTKFPATAGTGTQASPQNVLIIITDGAADETSPYQQFTDANVAQCTKIKTDSKYKVKIAVLYTQYIKETVNYTNNTGFNNFAANNIPYIQQQLQACSTQNSDGTYLMQTVSTGGDISAALNTLFAMAVQSARLVQ